MAGATTPVEGAIPKKKESTSHYQLLESKSNADVKTHTNLVAKTPVATCNSALAGAPSPAPLPPPSIKNNTKQQQAYKELLKQNGKNNKQEISMYTQILQGKQRGYDVHACA